MAITVMGVPGDRGSSLRPMGMKGITGMDKQQYTKTIEKIVANGYAYQAIADLINMLKDYNHNKDMVIAEMVAEKKAAIQILSSEAPVKNKMDAIRTLFT